jgi:hypothetical protein
MEITFGRRPSSRLSSKIYSKVGGYTGAPNEVQSLTIQNADL